MLAGVQGNESNRALGGVADGGAHLAKMPALDGMRAIAILVVMLSHTALGKVVPGGFGVTIFFFLSGFLITTLLRKENAQTGSVSLRNFYFKRTLRIFPPMYITIAAVAALTASGLLDRQLTAGGVAADLAFLTNYAPQIGVSGGVAIPLWSLDVEEHFYILFSALFAFVLCRMPARRAAAICAALASAILAIRLVTVFGMGEIENVFYWSHTRIDSILWGSVLALWQNPAMERGAWRPKIAHVALALVVLALCLAVRAPEFRETMRYSLQGAALFVIFSFVLHDRGVLARLLGSAPLRLVALLSYTLYLAHMPAIAIAEQWHLPLPALSGIALAFGYAALMYVAVEHPIARWRNSRLDRPRATVTSLPLHSIPRP